ncbi:MAG: Sialic acid-specific 9-O-acetylesterase [Mucilaginibacter sp.]|nr:Sialic acid-specific 9-O-acetylesterase [Mucilaginibacter sp.]
MKIYFLKALILVGLIFIAIATKADVTPNSLFSNNAVLQRDVEVPVWGTASEGEKIRIDFAGQHLKTVAKDGKWMVKLKSLKAGGPYTMTIKGDNTIKITNILVGEVWLCSGQSNMEWLLYKIIPQNGYPTVTEVLKDAENYPSIRQYFVPLHTYKDIPPPVDDAKGQWTVCDSVSAKKFSAVAYFFGKELYKHLKVPIGLINSSYGGTPAQNWTSQKVLDSVPGLKRLLTKYDSALRTFPERLKRYDDSVKQISQTPKTDSAAIAVKKVVPGKPVLRPVNPADRGGPGGLFNTMVYPLIPYAIRGVIWYQGEANAEGGIQYRTLFPAMINNWRAAWNRSDLPFFFVQLPGWKELAPELREAQLMTWQKLPNTAMAVITDVDDTISVHPPNKQPVGERLSLPARALVYHEKIEYAGPVYQSMQITGDTVVLTFTHTGTGIVAKGGELKDFTIAGDDKKFIAAQAIIKGDKVIIFSPAVSHPVAVRLGWRFCPQVNLYNKEGLVATSFRTDVTP